MNEAGSPARPSRAVNGVGLETRAALSAKRSIKGEAKRRGLLLAMSTIDLTTLEGKDTPEKVRGLCRKAVRPCANDEETLGFRVPGVAAVCVYPSLVAIAKEELAGSGVKVAAVATGFPSGQYPLAVRVRDTEEAISAGADEIDMVINRGAFLAGRYAEVGAEIREIAGVCAERTHLKVILETGELGTYDAIRRASEIAITALSESGLLRQPGGGFIKTSTGKVQPAATLPVTLLMLLAIRDHWMATEEVVGCKPAGGIRTAKQALQYLVMVHETMGPLTPGSPSPWMSSSCFRFGASALADDILRQVFKGATGAYAAGYDFAEA
jgi:deoxyribose-phosphate aldolase